MGSLHAVCLLLLLSVCHCSEAVDGRHSFSLTTFDPNGRLGQVERAITATTLGTPVVALCRQDYIVMGSLQALPSVLVLDDGTSRFARVSPSIAIATSGVGADGRIVAAAAQRLAVEHQYTFDEHISIETLLEEVSLLFQEYTVKPGSRPFGCTLLVAYMPSQRNVALKEGPNTPQLYRIDPSGSVESLGSYGIIGSHTNSIASQLHNLAGETNNATAASDLTSVANVFETYVEEVSSSDQDQHQNQNLRIITATLSREGLQIKRNKLRKT